MTITIETYERIWRETNDEYNATRKRKLNLWNEIYDRKVSEELARIKGRI